MIEQFSNDVDQGLSQPNKHLPSKYFYDKKGDHLFVQIMSLPEYYLTRAEMEIFSEQLPAMIEAFKIDKTAYFELIELGAGDGTKTKKLLEALSNQAYQFDYIPIDISHNALDQLEKSLADELPHVSVKPQQGDYFEILESLKNSHHPKVLLFLGSNIGNMFDEEASRFIAHLGESLNPGDKMLLGVDLIKPVEKVLPAYNDSKGITRDFNLNLLMRINRELGGDFNLDAFDHAPHYTEDEGIAKSYLKSLKSQKVMIQHLGKSYSFEEGEKVHTEISRKYNDTIVDAILENTRFRVADKLSDRQNLFADYVLVIQ